MVVLDCNHKFCYDCLLESYKGIKCNFTSVTNHRICPYCRKKSSLLPIKNGIQPIKGIHFYNKINNKMNNTSCNGIIKSGPNKGSKCSCKCKPNELYCGRHISQKTT